LIVGHFDPFNCLKGGGQRPNVKLQYASIQAQTYNNAAFTLEVIKYADENGSGTATRESDDGTNRKIYIGLNRLQSFETCRKIQFYNPVLLGWLWPVSE
jgi:hypothetical protein